jgi:hypothetical protein
MCDVMCDGGGDRRVGDEIRVGVFANRLIPVGTELTIDYRYERIGSVQRQPCHCGEPNCAKFIGGEKKAICKLPCARCCRLKLGAKFCAVVCSGRHRFEQPQKAQKMERKQTVSSDQRADRR